MASKTKARKKQAKAKIPKKKSTKRYGEEKDPDEIRDIARGLEQGVDKEEGAECGCAENADEMKRIKRSSVLEKEEEEEVEDDEISEYGEGGINADDEGTK